MKRYVFVAAILTIVIAVCGCAAKKSSTSSTGTQSQASAPAGSPAGGGGFGAFQQFRESHKYTFMLTRMTVNIAKLETESDAPLTPEQAKTILGILEPLRKQTTLSQNDAKTTAMKVKAVLTEKQLTEMGKMKQPERRPGQGQGQGQGQNGQRQRPSFDLAAMKDFNPFNPSKDNPMAARSAKRINMLFDVLQKKASGEQAKPK